MNEIRVPVGWDAIRGEPQFEIVFQLPGANVLLSEVTMERLQRIWMPVQLLIQIVVAEAFKRSHDDDEARYHRNRPALKHCPFDEACRFV